ncbi:cornifelin homolog B-like [Gigantopelta aegis]|uniref:cornifelin homolog B-like n=1 Tax=Gigantopelta aegis TaxID=1735272 RepID=UPI001B8889C8|nr:cornifelin homolog B-like [Gigantopelta aegis]XP_041360697.1 cornifelin homolog B-like [Gigantopelta aegis]XP_041360698.1 cornifelin homolog B-like [Gigantopelta aegis]
MSSPVTSQPQPFAAQGQRLWSSGTFGCFSDMGSCLIGTLCPVILAMRIAGDMGESSCVPCCVPASTIVMRTKTRMMFNIQGSIMDDCLITHFCCPCVICQMARELEYVKKIQQ